MVGLSLYSCVLAVIITTDQLLGISLSKIRKPKVPKLVRNKIPDIIREAGKIAVVRTASLEEAPPLLIEKIEEEIAFHFGDVLCSHIMTSQKQAKIF